MVLNHIILTVDHWQRLRDLDQTDHVLSYYFPALFNCSFISSKKWVLSVAFPFWIGTLFSNSAVVESLSLLFLSRSSNHLGLPLFSLLDSLTVHWKFSDAKLSMVTFISTFYFQGFFALNTGNTLSLSFFSFYGAGTVLPIYSTWAERLCSNF